MAHELPEFFTSPSASTILELPGPHGETVDVPKPLCCKEFCREVQSMVAMDSFRKDLRERLRKPEIVLRIASPAFWGLVELSGTDLVDSAERLAKDLVKFPPPGVVLLLLPHSVELFLLQIGLVLQGYCPAILPWPTSRIDPEKYQRNLLHQLRDLPADQLITVPQLAANLGPKLAFQYAGCNVRGSGAFESAFARAFAVDVAADGTTITPEAGPPGPDALSAILGRNHRDAEVGGRNRPPAGRAAPRLRDSLDFSEADGVVSWLPLYHDMGLIACLWFPLWFGTPSLHFSASEWLMNPQLLFKYIADFRATFCWLPNFAFSYLAQRREAMNGNYSLSHMRAWINCSEPVRLRSMRSFAESFSDWGVTEKALQASYAMAENVFAVTQSRPGKPLQLSRAPHYGEPGSTTGIFPLTLWMTCMSLPASPSRTLRFELRIGAGRPVLRPSPERSRYERRHSLAVTGVARDSGKGRLPKTGGITPVITDFLMGMSCT